MQWEWIVPVIVLVVWILMQVIRPAEEQQQEKDARPLPRGDDGDAPARPASEVDRFLEEINRMRRKAAEDQGRAPPVEAPRPRSAPLPMGERVETVPMGQRVEAVPLGRRLEEIPTVEAAAKQPQSRSSRRVAATPPPPVPVIEALAAAPALPSLHKSQSKTAALPSAAAVNLQALLRTPQSVRTAILLQEVLSPPRSRRPLRADKRHS